MTSRLKRITTLAVQASAQRAASRKIALGSERALRPADKATGRGRGQVAGKVATSPHGPALAPMALVRHCKVSP